MLYIKDNGTIRLTRGDTARLTIPITNSANNDVSLVFALTDSVDGEIIVFTAVGPCDLGTDQPQYISALGYFGSWKVLTGTLAKLEDIPAIPTELKNPHALTIKIGSTTVTYDGSAAQTVTIDDGTEVSY